MDGDNLVTHEELKRMAVNVIQAVFSDLSVTTEQSVDTLEDLAEEAKSLAETLRKSLK